MTDGDTLILSHLWIVKSLASTLKRSLLFSADWDDLISAGNFGLVKAGRNFKGGNGCQFKTYAFKCVRGEMIKSFTRIDGHHNSALIQWEELKDAPCPADQESLIYEREKRERMATMIDCLQPHHREVIQAFIAGKSLVGFAREQGMKRDRVMKWQRTAIKTLMKGRD